MSHPTPTAVMAWRSFASLRGLICTIVLLCALGINFLPAEGHDQQRIYELLTLLLGALVFVLQGSQQGVLHVLGRPVQSAALIFFTIGLASSFLALSLRHALFDWSSLFLLALLAICIAAEIAKAGNAGLRSLLRIIGAICLLYSLRILLFHMAALANGYLPTTFDLAVGFSNHRFLNHTQTALLPLLVLLCLQAPARSALRLGSFCLAAFWWAMLYVCEARSSLLALGVAGAVLLFLRRARARSFLRMMLLTALGGCLAYLLAFVLLPILFGLQPFGSVANTLERTAADPASGRLFLWTRAIELVAQHPWFGVGPLHFAHYAADLQVGAHPHNWLFQIGAEWGMPALLCLLFIVGAGLQRLRDAGKRIAPDDLHNQQFLSAFLAASVAILIDGLFSGVFVMPQSRLAIVLVFGCAAGWVRSLTLQPEQVKVSGASRAGLVLVVVAAACALVYSVAPDVAARVQSAPLSAAEKASNPDVHWPRLWEAGYF